MTYNGLVEMTIFVGLSFSAQHQGADIFLVESALGCSDPERPLSESGDGKCDEKVEEA